MGRGDNYTHVYATLRFKTVSSIDSIHYLGGDNGPFYLLSLKIWQMKSLPLKPDHLENSTIRKFAWINSTAATFFKQNFEIFSFVKPKKSQRFQDAHGKEKPKVWVKVFSDC